MLQDIHSRIHDFTVKNIRKIFVNKLLPESHKILKRLTRPLFNFDEHIPHELDDLCHISGSPVPLISIESINSNQPNT